MRIRKPKLLATLCFILLALSPLSFAARKCGPNACVAYLSEKLPVPHAQQTAVWCWAASIQTIFSYYGYEVNQDTIVSRYFGKPVVVNGNPYTMSNAFNTHWVDNEGKHFSSHSPITDLYWHTKLEVNNEDIVQALVDETPVFYGDRTHAMVLVSVDYSPSPAGPQILGAWVIDPFPGPTYGLRRAVGNELQGYFVAIPDVEQDADATHSDDAKSSPEESTNVDASVQGGSEWPNPDTDSSYDASDITSLHSSKIFRFMVRGRNL